MVAMAEAEYGVAFRPSLWTAAQNKSYIPSRIMSNPIARTITPKISRAVIVIDLSGLNGFALSLDTSVPFPIGLMAAPHGIAYVFHVEHRSV